MIGRTTQIAIPLSPQYCLLGLVEPLAAAAVAKGTLVSLLLFYACIAIMCWKQVSPATVSFWMRFDLF